MTNTEKEIKEDMIQKMTILLSSYQHEKDNLFQNK